METTVVVAIVELAVVIGMAVVLVTVEKNCCCYFRNDSFTIGRTIVVTMETMLLQLLYK